MDIQELLKTHSLAYLEEHHGVKARICGHKVGLNYSQLEAKDSDPISQQCRGLVVAPVPFRTDIDPSQPLGDTVVLARPFDRFFNLGQDAAAQVDLNHKDTRFYEKMDGTLTILYHDPFKGEWHVGTRSVPEADLPIDGFGDYTFRSLFERAFLDTTGLELATVVSKLDKGMTYIFELTSPVNRIVVDYEVYGITLLGARRNVDGREYDPASAATFPVGVPWAHMYRFGNIQEMVDFVSSQDPKDHEGIVVCDPWYRRVKVKSPAYLALNKVRDSVMNSPRGLVELILLDKLDDALPLFPEHIQVKALALRESFANLARAVHHGWVECSKEADEVCEGLQDLDEAARVKAHRKAFALAVQGRQGAWMAPLMDQYQGRSEGLVGWAMSKRQVDGGWSNSFLDSLLEQAEALTE